MGDEGPRCGRPKPQCAAKLSLRGAKNLSARKTLAVGRETPQCAAKIPLWAAKTPGVRARCDFLLGTLPAKWAWKAVCAMFAGKVSAIFSHLARLGANGGRETAGFSPEQQKNMANGRKIGGFSPDRAYCPGRSVAGDLAWQFFYSITKSN